MRLSVPSLQLAGISLKRTLIGGGKDLPKGRAEFKQYHSSATVPSKWESSVVCGQRRLMRGKELYDIKADPGQKDNVAH